MIVRDDDPDTRKLSSWIKREEDDITVSEFLPNFIRDLLRDLLFETFPQVHDGMTFRNFAVTAKASRSTTREV
jgi:hypothetical protein